MAKIPSFIPVPRFCTVEELEEVVRRKTDNDDTNWSDLINKVIRETIRTKQVTKMSDTEKKVAAPGGFAQYMQNRATGVAGTAFNNIPIIGGDTKPGDMEAINDSINRIELEILGAAATQVRDLSEKLGFANPGEVMNNALHFYLNMITEALDNGFTQILLHNPETEQLIEMNILPDTADE